MGLFGPMFLDESGAEAFALWAEIPFDDADLICGVGRLSSEIEMFYGTYSTHDVTAKQAAAALRRYLTTELEVTK